MGAADALAALELFPETEEYQVLLENFQNHAGNLSFWQSEEDGRWHNIIKGKTFSIWMHVYFFNRKRVQGTVVCRIVRRLLSSHKWQFSGMADTHKYCSQHSAHLVYSPIFHGLNLIIFS